MAQKWEEEMKAIIALSLLILTGCAVYTFNETTETLDELGQIVTRHTITARAWVANSSDQVMLDLQTRDKVMKFGKTNTNAKVQADVISSAVAQALCAINPASCAPPIR